MMIIRRLHVRRLGARTPLPGALSTAPGTPNLRTNILDFRGFDSSIILI